MVDKSIRRRSIGQGGRGKGGGEGGGRGGGEIKEKRGSRKRRVAESKRQRERVGKEE
jgi:hypothetical protein